MASELPALWEGGQAITMAERDDDALSAVASTKSKAKSKASSRARSRKGDVKTLSSSFHCWKLVPDT